MSRVYNFSAGPAVLPEDVLKEAAAEMLDYKGTGMSVMEMSHRSKAYDAIIKDAESDLRDLLHIPDNYKVLFLQGGASQQFAMVPMNLMKNKAADYIVTGQWAKKAYQEGQMYGRANAIASSADKTFSYIPDCSDLDVSDDADYVYICENNTIYGTKFWTLPNTKGKLLVADQSSCMTVNRFNILHLPFFLFDKFLITCLIFNVLNLSCQVFGLYLLIEFLLDIFGNLGIFLLTTLSIVVCLSKQIEIIGT